MAEKGGWSEEVEKGKGRVGGEKKRKGKGTEEVKRRTKRRRG
jgi:hypothetical protein